jgi:hypothetical protein
MIQRALFQLGSLVATPGALAAFTEAGETPLLYIARHARGDWGELDEEDLKENQFSLENGFRLLNAYRLNDSTKFWVVTEADRSATTIFIAV